MRLVFFVLIMGFMVVFTEQRRCPRYWTRLGKTCYGLMLLRVTWPEAEIICNAHDSHLAKIDSQLVTTYLTGFTFRSVSAVNTPVWIGGNNAVTGQQFVWSKTGDVFTYTNWDPNQPQNDSGEHCVALTATSAWVALTCADALQAVCEREIA